MNRIGSILIGVLLVIILAASTLFVVDQRQFAVVYALGEIKEVISEPGLKVKLPAHCRTSSSSTAASSMFGMRRPGSSSIVTPHRFS